MAKRKRGVNAKMNMARTFRDKLQLHLPIAAGSSTLGWQLLFFYIPLFLMFFSSFARMTPSGHFSGFTLDHFRQICSRDYFLAIWYSLSLALSTSFLTFALGFPLAHFIVFRGGRFKKILLFLLIIPFWTNFLLHIYAWFFVLERAGFLNQLLLFLHLIKKPIAFLHTPFAVHLMMLYYYLPFMALPLYSSLEKFDPTLIEASLDLGASKSDTFRRILLPITLPAIKTGFFLVFIPSFGEFVIPELMGGDRYFYVGSVVSQLILSESTTSLATAFTVMSGFILLMTSLGLIFFWKAVSRLLNKETFF